ncbi:MAG: carboxypeptidase-like regulatory domain-containing protein [Actinobacteria bacterium]|nr:carboxypeptidase-like regulatory domain-containing protein [Actinomycetota bacterium]
MRRTIKALFTRFNPQTGFSLVEVLVGGFVLVVGLVLMAQFFASAASRVMDSDIRSVLHQVATQDVESIRGLNYEDVGTTDGHPHGVLAPDEDRTVQNLDIHLHREVVFWTDSSYTGPYPANYRRVTVSVSASNHDELAPVELVTNVAGGVPGGTIQVTVVDSMGLPVPDAQIVVTDTHLIPNVNITATALRTDSTGQMMIPGLTPDGEEGYSVAVSKAGYNSDSDGPKVVLDGQITEYTLTIDRLSTMTVAVVDTNGVPVTGLNITVVGPESFSESFASAASPTVFANIRFSNENDPYIVRLLEGQGYDAQEKAIALVPGSTQDVVFVVPAGGPTTTTTLPPTTTTTLAPTTTTSTTAGTGSLTVTVRTTWNGWTWPVSNAQVTLFPGGQSLYTNSSGIVSFTPLVYGTYSIVVHKWGYSDYHGDNILVNGAISINVQLGW